MLLYELISTFVDLDSDMITEGFVMQVPELFKRMLDDYDRFDNNSCVLAAINQVFLSVST